MNQTIELIVSPTGETRVQTRGYSGGNCRAASRFLEEALGERTSERLTAEFHQTAPQHQSLPQSQK